MRRRSRDFFALTLVVIASILTWGNGAVAADASKGRASGPARSIPITGAIGPATSNYVVDELKDAARAETPLVILRIDTPGGLSGAMRDIVKAILASPVPVIGYVGPAGARAASAGTYILYATNIAAMAPATNLGAATPITIGGGGSSDENDSSDKADHSKQPNKKNDSSGNNKSSNNASPTSGDAGGTEKRKMVNDAVAYIRSLAERRGRNANWAEKAVRQAASLSARQALKQNVINVMANNEQQLLVKLNGRRVTTANGPQTLHTQGLFIDQRTPGWRTQLLSIVTDPTVAYMLFLVGIVGLVIEGFNPGSFLPGIVGAVALITALFAFQVLPINYAGLLLMVLGLGLVVAEAFVPSFGALGIGGVVSFVYGSVMLMDTDVPGYSVSIGVIIGIAVAALAVLGLVIWLFARSKDKRIQTGHEGLIGSPCVALGNFAREGRVLLHGESWRAIPESPVISGQNLIVTATEGLTVYVCLACDAPESQRAEQR